jgi:hypothetical protein
MGKGRSAFGASPFFAKKSDFVFFFLAKLKKKGPFFSHKKKRAKKRSKREINLSQQKKDKHFNNFG